MATQRFTAGSAAYVQVSTASDVFLTLESVNTNVRVHFGASQPVADTDDYLTLTQNSRGLVKKAGQPAGNVYIRANSPGEIVSVSVS